MPNYHRTTIIGHLGRDPEIRYLPSGEAVANFSVAVTDSWKDKSGVKQERVTWYRCNAFAKLAEICGQYLKKGAPVFIEGSMQHREYRDKDGNKRESWELRADTMQMLGGRGDGGSAEPARGSSDRPAQRSPAGGAHGGNFNDFDDDIPY